jgi:hypothetical protein
MSLRARSRGGSDEARMIEFLQLGSLGAASPSCPAAKIRTAAIVAVIPLTQIPHQKL